MRRPVGLLGLVLLGLTLAVGMFGASVASATPPTTAIRYVYDADGHLKAVINPASETALYGWDPAGNLTSIGLKSSTKLSIIQLTPAQGAVGETVTISGTGFSTTPSSDTVKFNGTAATVSAATALSLTVKVPTGATSGTVTVQTTTEGPVTSAQSFTVGSSAPKATSLSTTVASPASEVTLTGSNFEPNAYDDVMEVNQTQAYSTSASGTSITFTVPGATGSGHVSVMTPQGSATGPVLYIPPDGLAASKVGSTSQISLGGAASTVKLTTAEKVGLVAFEGTAGQRISVLASESSIEEGHMSIFTPQNTEITSVGAWFGVTQPGFVEPVTLPTTGMYTILLQPTRAPETGSVKVAAYSVTNVTGTIEPTTSGAVKSVSLTAPGDRAVYTVPVTAGEAVAVNIAKSAFSEGALKWKTPEGALLAEYGSLGNGFFNQVEFPTTGNYTLEVVPHGSQTGSLELTAYNATDVTGTITPTSSGESKTVTISVPGQDAKVTFEGKSGQRVSLVASESSMEEGHVGLLNSEGKELVVLW